MIKRIPHNKTKDDIFYLYPTQDYCTIIECRVCKNELAIDKPMEEFLNDC
jgi:hypothetical protein